MLLLLGIFVTMLGPATATQPPHLFVQQQSFLNSISGHVSDGRSAIPNLQVELLNDMDSVIQRSKFDSSGLKQSNKLAESKSPDAHGQLALLFDDLKRYREAADELELFLKVLPDSKDTELIKELIQRLRQNASSGTKQ